MNSVNEKRARDERAQNIKVARQKLVSAAGRLTLESHHDSGVDLRVVRIALRELAEVHALLDFVGEG